MTKDISEIITLEEQSDTSLSHLAFAIQNLVCVK